MKTRNLGLIQGIILCRESDFPGNNEAEVWGQALRIRTFRDRRNQDLTEGKIRLLCVHIIGLTWAGTILQSWRMQTWSKELGFLYRPGTACELLQGRTHELRWNSSLLSRELTGSRSGHVSSTRWKSLAVSIAGEIEVFQSWRVWLASHSIYYSPSFVLLRFTCFM